MIAGPRTRLGSAILIALAVAALGIVLTWDLIPGARRSTGGGQAGVSPEPVRSRRGAAVDPHLVTEGERVFGEQCAQCHGPQADWPLAGRLKGRTRGEFYALLDHLPMLNPVMPGFQGTNRERRALATYLSSLQTD